MLEITDELLQLFLIGTCRKEEGQDEHLGTLTFLKKKFWLKQGQPEVYGVS